MNDLPEPEPNFPDPGQPERQDWSGVVFAIGVAVLVAVVWVLAWLE